MKLTLLNVESNIDSGHPPLGIAYIASYLKKYNNINKIFIVDKEKDVINNIIKSDPDILGISSVTVEFNNTIALVNQIKQELNIPIIIGGPHPSALPEQSLRDTGADIAVVGEGEKTFSELIEAYTAHNKFVPEVLKSINGICYKRNNEYVTTPKRELIQDLDSIPFPARDLLKMEKYYLIPKRTVLHNKLTRGTHIITSRGCPYSCSFCSSNKMWGKVIRYHSPEYTVNEIKLLIENYKIKSLFILDDLFAMNLKRLNEIKRLFYENRLKDKLEISIQSRTNIIGEEKCKVLKEIGVKEISFGLESGSQKILDFLNKQTTIEHHKTAIKLCNKHDILVNGFFMMGIPSETKDDMKSTLNFIKNNRINSLQINILVPFPGTELWNFLEKNNLLEKYNWKDFSVKSPNIYVNTAMSKSDFIEVYNKIKKESEEKELNIDIEFSHFFSRKIIKSAISKPKLTLKILKNRCKVWI